MGTRISQEQQKIICWLKKLKFKKKLFGGLDEMDVWKKMEELNSMYETALAAERMRCEMMIEMAQKSAADAKDE